MFAKFLFWLDSFLENFFYHPETDPKTLPMNQESPPHYDPKPVPPVKTVFLWNTPDRARHSVRVICDEEGLTTEEKNTLCATVGGESGWIPEAVGPLNKDGTRDYGICQINSHYWIGPGKFFPTTDYVIDNPEACIRWMCKQWKMGYRNWWIAYKNSRYKSFL